MREWFMPPDARLVSADLDVRVGGRFFIRSKGDNGEDHGVGGVYREVVPDKKLVFTWAWQTTPERESLVTLTLKPDGAGTILTLQHERFFDEAARNGHERGWSHMLDILTALYDEKT